jgi:eukaryotic-like serine/threonine-protein kinase
MAREIVCARHWTARKRIGGGGFGQVYEAESEGEHAALKLIPKDPGADRELLFVDLDGLVNVIPVIDSGETEDEWVIVMPRAEMSLREHLKGAGAALPVDDALTIVRDIVESLVSLDGKVVHRDIKPENVLLLDGTWCLADFGISRYAEATTAPDTRKHALSPPYAAPERWRSERASIATDVYSAGIIAFEMLSGSLPFTGPTVEDFRDQHLHATAHDLAGAPASVAAMVSECLYKSSEARPSPANLAARLDRTARASAGGLAQLQEANRSEVKRRAETERQAQSQRSAAERRSALVSDAKAGLDRIVGALRDAILEAASSAELSSARGAGWSLKLGSATLRFSGVQATAADPWNWTAPAFEVLAHASLELETPSNRMNYEGRSHSLWFCDAQQGGQFAWYETAFMISPMIARRGRKDPFALDPGEDAAKAVWNGMAEFQVAWPFTALVVGELDEFINRWAGWLATASDGALPYPSQMPERPTQGTWRTG